ncbi:DUF480 domain-containing protein [Enemella evansiae]|uniref:DUF480 domain-containing protein n=1 Tax=Enemella evansiae TaxID=2016499 RepID=UPI001E3EF5B8|nr:DUF480 domain-containing protein [Enemella evansiae]
MAEIELDAIEQRVLGSLLEKQKTVPGSYPLSLNALRTACNQTSSREPVSDYDDQQLEACLRGLKDRELVRFVWAGKGSRALKYHQRLDEQLELADDERALITVLLLRGPQSAGELKTRTDRLFPFPDKEAAEQVLRRLAERDTPLTRELERLPGHRDPRWVHLLGPVEGIAEPAAPVAAVDRDQVLADGAAARDERVRASYDALAEAYAERFGDELAGKPFDRWLLGRLAAESTGPIADIGTGPGQTTRVLADAGAEVTGFDLSPEMIRVARETHPDLRFEVADFNRLLRPPNAAAWGTIVAWYAGVHLSGSELAPWFGALARILAPGGRIAVALHAGAEVRHTEEYLDRAVSLDFVLHDPEEIKRAAEQAGLEIEEWYLRGPLAGMEPETDRFYLVAQQP